jgi:transposase
VRQFLDGVPMRKLAKRYGVSEQSIRGYVRG